MGKLTKEEYITIKQLLDKGHEGQAVAKIVERGTGTVSTVKNTKDYNEYRHRLKNLVAKRVKIPKQLRFVEPRYTKLDELKDLLRRYNRTRGLREATDVCEYLNKKLNMRGGRDDAPSGLKKNA